MAQHEAPRPGPGSGGPDPTGEDAAVAAAWRVAPAGGAQTGARPVWVAGLFPRSGFSKVTLALPVFGIALILLLRSWGTISPVPLSIYAFAVGIALLIGIVLKPWSVPYPPGRRLYVELAALAAEDAFFVYMTGWGPGLSVAFVFVGSVSLIRHGSRAWKAVVITNGVAICLGQLAVATDIAPSKLDDVAAQTLATMGLMAFVLMIGYLTLVVRQMEQTSRELERSEVRFRSLLQHSSDTTIVFDPGGLAARYASPATFELLDVAPECFYGRSVIEFVHPEDAPRVRAEVSSAFLRKAVTRTEFRVVTGSGAIRHVEGTLTDLRTNDAIGGIVINLHDITAGKRLQERLSHDVHHDALTDLPNRRYFLDRLREAISRSRRTGVEPVVFFLDLDGFKQVNDRHGHGVGDAVLVQLSQRMQSVVREYDTLARLAGDEFVVLSEHTFDGGEATAFATRLLGCVDAPFHVASSVVRLSMSVGIAFARPGMTADQVLDGADRAMYVAKRTPARHLAISDPTGSG